MHSRLLASGSVNSGLRALEEDDNRQKVVNAGPDTCKGD